MSEFTIRSDSIDVEQIMEGIRARIRDKRGTDYTETQIRELADVKLERFLDPRGIRSDLLQHYRRQSGDPSAQAMGPEPARVPPSFEFDPSIIYRSSRGLAGRLLSRVRRILNPLLKFFFNPTPIAHALSLQQTINERQREANEYQRYVNERQAEMRENRDTLTYEMLHNLVLELTRLSIGVKNDHMLVASMAGRLDLAERRARALEKVVAYRKKSADILGNANEATLPRRRKARTKRRHRHRKKL